MAAVELETWHCPPVMICGFNRPDCLRRVFEAVRQVRPKRLFLVLDAPREGRQADVEGWKACQEVFDKVDWPCDVQRNYAQINMGCRDRMVSGISWVFEQVDRAVLLEDDCVPDQTFFRFCAELLERYKDDSRVGMIAGHDEHLHMSKVDFHGDSYYFDRMSSIWGWATWRRAWRQHDSEMTYWPKFRSRFEAFNGIFRNHGYTQRRMLYTDKLYRREAGAWAGIWCTTMYKENWLCIHPTVNLVTNVGAGYSSRTDARTRCLGAKNPWENRKTMPMKFPLVHPLTMTPNVLCERFYLIDVCNFHPLLNRIKSLPGWIRRRVLMLKAKVRA